MTTLDLTKITVFWDVTPYRLVDWYQHFGEICRVLLKGSKHILPKRWCVSTKLYGVTSLKTTAFILTALRASGSPSFTSMISALSPYQPVYGLQAQCINQATKRCCYVTIAACLSLTYSEATVGHNLLVPHHRSCMTYAAGKTSLNNPCDEEYCVQGCNSV
jgi:hypothetical protein